MTVRVRGLGMAGTAFFLTQLISCAGQGSQYSTRHAFSEGLGPNDKVAVVLEKYSFIEEGWRKDSQPKTNVCLGGGSDAGKERSIYRCITRGLGDSGRVVPTIAPEDFWAIFVTGNEMIPAGSESLLESLNLDSVCNSLEGLRVRYVVLANVTTIERRPEQDFGAAEIGVIYKANWDRSTRVKLTVIDVKLRQMSGKIESFCYGKEGVLAGCCLIVPIYVPYSTATETSACVAAGRELASYLTYRSTRRPNE